MVHDGEVIDVFRRFKSPMRISGPSHIGLGCEQFIHEYPFHCDGLNIEGGYVILLLQDPFLLIVGKVIELAAELEEIEEQIRQKCREIPHAEYVLDIPGLGDTIVSGILAEMGDIERFDAAKEIQKLSGLGLVACSSGKHKGQTKISHRGRKRLRYWLFQGALSVVSHNEAFRQIHEYYTTRAENPLKKMQSITVIACKLLRIIFTILKKGVRFDPEKMLSDIVRPASLEAAA